MIEDLEWRWGYEVINDTEPTVKEVKELWAYDGHQWFKVPTREGSE